MYCMLMNKNDKIIIDEELIDSRFMIFRLKLFIVC